MAEAEKYDILILGSGTAGKGLAWAMGKDGKRTAVVERKYIGGSCPNIACLPSKNVIRSAEVASLIGRHDEFGIDLEAPSVDMHRVYERKRRMVDGLKHLHMDLYKASGAELIWGEGRFVAPRTVQVGDRTLSGERVFLNLGSHAAIPDIPGLRAAKPMTHIEALDLERLPRHLIVLGGGYVGLELAQAMRRFGSRVTLIERGPQLVAREDPDISRSILELFQDEGIDVLLNASIQSIEGVSGDRVHVQTQNGAIEGTDLLAALGRVLNTRGIGLAEIGVKVTESGHIQVNDRLETTAPNVWAMGECAGSPYFTHVAWDDFRIVYENLNGGHRSTRSRLIPYCVFIDPPLARVGMTESEAKAARIDYRLFSMPMSGVLRTRTLSETRGFMKILVGRNDLILGFAAFGAEASELMSNVQVAMLAGQPYTILRDAIFTHPTMSEGFNFLFSGTPGA